MPRTVDRLEGIALVGMARVGALAFSTPGLAESQPPADDGAGLTLRSRPSPAGTRELTLANGTGQLDLHFPILAPEVMGAPGTGLPVGDGAVLVHAPLSPPPELPRSAPVPT